jgi:copper chaperone CopZ
MKKKYKCEVDCANCAAKLEDAIRRVDGVEEAVVNFLTQKLTLVAPDERFDEVLEAVIAKAKKVEPDTVIHVNG